MQKGFKGRIFSCRLALNREAKWYCKSVHKVVGVPEVGLHYIAGLLMPFCTMLYSKINILVAMFRPIPDPTLWEKTRIRAFLKCRSGSDQNPPGSESTTSFFNLKLEIGQIRYDVSITK